MNWNPLILLLPIFLTPSYGVRLHKFFQFLDGFKADYKLRGYLHLGYDYAVFLRLPKPHDKFLVYELYEAKKIADVERTKPRILAISKVPVDFIKEQLKIFREELYKAKYVDENVVPGTRVKTLREWQLDKLLSGNRDETKLIQTQPYVLRTKV
ncbi:uncharacterized protein LOC126369118 [Pectinophora gossypiella]|uniref:uncharacterized protein LOC126369118 n=1 Tax=Pectinophora gossypiella TaxID=13191 RepID=UPI00214E48AF|nr:uncharacterized protein LOC126369118 [Pectinophora gossypiella]